MKCKSLFNLKYGNELNCTILTAVQCTVLTAVQCTNLTAVQCTNLTAVQCTNLTAVQCTNLTTVQCTVYTIITTVHKVSPDNLYIGAALTFVVIMSGLFTYYQEDKSGRIMESFERLVPPSARVLRGGRVASLEASHVVIGDVVDIAGGDKVPADLRILEASGLKVTYTVGSYLTSSLLFVL